MTTVWKTKYGPRRVRRETPTVAEAIAAAGDLTDDPQSQAEFAASLMGLPVEQVRAEMLKLGVQRKSNQTVAFTNRPGGPRAVVVERKRVIPRITDRISAPRS